MIHIGNAFPDSSPTGSHRSTNVRTLTNPEAKKTVSRFLEYGAHLVQWKKALLKFY